MGYKNLSEKERIQILQDDQDSFIIKIFMGLGGYLFDLLTLIIFIFCFKYYLIVGIFSNNIGALIMLIISIGLSSISIMALLTTGMVFYIIRINKVNKTFEITKDFIFFTLKTKKFPIDYIKEIKNEIISDSDGFTFTKYYSSKLVLKNDKKIEIYYGNLLYLKKDEIDIIRGEVGLLKYLLESNLRM